MTILALALLLTMTQSKASAQLTGTKTIPGTYASIKLAIDDLNANGVGTGGVTFDIAPGFTETIPMGGLIIDITANQPTSGNPVVFQRSGAGTNPLIQTDINGSGVLSGGGFGARKDAILWLVGTDYITINNIDFTERYTGGSQTLKTEYGIEMVRKDGTDGCKHVTITGCTVRMQQSDIGYTCITSLNVNLAGVITNPTTIGGRHESISVQGCTLDNSFNGMYFQGYGAPAPYDLFDHFYNIGGITGNTLINIGTGLSGFVNSSVKYGILSFYTDSIIISNNTVRVNTSSNSQVYGIYLGSGRNSSATISNNDVSDTIGGTTQEHYPIYCELGELGVDNTVNITNNTIHDCRYDGATSAVNAYIYVAANPYTVDITGNTIRDNYVGNGSSTATGNMYGIYRSSSNTNFGSSFTVSNNTIKNLRRNQSAPGSGTGYGVYVQGGAYNYEVSDNTVDSIFSTSSSGSTMGIVCAYTSPGMISIHDNTIGNLKKESGTTGNVYGIFSSSNTDTISLYNNTVFNLYHRASSGTTAGYFVNNSASEGFVKIYDNIAHDIYATSIAKCLGINAVFDVGSSIRSIYGNTTYSITNDSTGASTGINAQSVDIGVIHSNRVYDIFSKNNNSTGAAVTGIQIYGISSDSKFNIYNNMISEIYAPVCNSNLGILGLFINGGDTTDISYNTIYLDGSSAGPNAGCNAIFINGPKATLKNNIIINKFASSSTGQTIGINKFFILEYDTASNNNNVYVPAGATNYFYHDGTTGYTTFSGFQTAVSPAETNSFAENSPFKNVSTHPYDLDIDSTQTTLCEGGAMPIAGITTDIHGNTRNPSTPDVGADEFDQVITNIEPTSSPTVYELYQNYPNPFNPSTKIKFDIPKSGFVSLKIYDITGREVSTLVNSELATGRYEFEWNGGQFASGVYFFRITAGDFVKVQKMMLIK